MGCPALVLNALALGRAERRALAIGCAATTDASAAAQPCPQEGLDAEDASAKPLGIPRVVRREYDCAIAPVVVEEGEREVASPFIQTGKRLIEKRELCGRGKRAGELEAASLAARERARRPAGDLGKPELGEQRARVRAGGDEEHVVQTAQLIDEAGVLEDDG